MSRWFRFYDEVLDDPKVQNLPPDMFRHWVNLLCLASRNEGALPSEKDCAFALRLDDNAIRTVVERLLNEGLIDSRRGGINGIHYAPHAWEKRQYKSDSSTERVKRFRNATKPLHATGPDTDTDTDTDTDSEQKKENSYDKEKDLVRVTIVDPHWPILKTKWQQEHKKPLNLTEFWFPRKWLEEGSGTKAPSAPVEPLRETV